jgi:hypothetical protein
VAFTLDTEMREASLHSEFLASDSELLTSDSEKLFKASLHSGLFASKSDFTYESCSQIAQKTTIWKMS